MITTPQLGSTSTMSERRELMQPKEVANLLGVSTKTLERWRADRIGPPWLRLPGSGPRPRLRYSRNAVHVWVKSQLQTTDANVELLDKASLSDPMRQDATPT